MTSPIHYGPIGANEARALLILQSILTGLQPVAAASMLVDWVGVKPAGFAVILLGALLHTVNQYQAKRIGDTVQAANDTMQTANDREEAAANVVGLAGRKPSA